MAFTISYSVEAVPLPVSPGKWKGAWTVLERPPGRRRYRGELRQLFPDEVSATHAALAAGEAKAKALARPKLGVAWQAYL